MKMYLLVYIFLLPAAVSDRKDKKIKNRWILLALAIVVPLAFCHEGVGPGTALLLLLRLIWPICFFYPFFLCGGIGAGDVKLLAALSVLFCFREMLLFLFFSSGGSFFAGPYDSKEKPRKVSLAAFLLCGKNTGGGLQEKVSGAGTGGKNSIGTFSSGSLYSLSFF